MKFIEHESEQKLRGGFYTDPAIAAFLADWVLRTRPKRILEPSCGDGVFIEAVARADCASVRRVVACEIDPVEAGKAKERLRSNRRLQLQIHEGDFLKWFLFHGDGAEPFDAVLGNPPFIRYQYLDDTQQFLAGKVFARFGLPFTKHTNAWVPFVIAALSMLAPGGRMAMVIPSEIFHIPHAQSLRRYLAEHCARILILDPEQIWFGDTLQGTVLLLAEKRGPGAADAAGVAVVPAAHRRVLLTDPEELFQKAAYAGGVALEGKWMSVFLAPTERALLAALRHDPRFKRFDEVAAVDVGIVTGANKFFLVPDGVVAEYGLEPWAHPMFGRSEHARGLIYSKNDHAENKAAGLPANFLWFQEETVEALPANVQDYLRLGLEQALHKRFKCRTRNPWYTVPSVHTTPVAMLKRSHHYPRLVLNSARAYTTDTAYRIRPLSLGPEALVLGFVNSLTCLTAEIEGRHYGGGVLELVPSEIERLLLPVIAPDRGELAEADLRFRRAQDHAAFLREQDACILGRIGLGGPESETLHRAWLKLRDRRLRTPADTEAGETEAGL